MNSTGKFIIYAQRTSSGPFPNSTLTIMDDHFNVVSEPIGGGGSPPFPGVLTLIENTQRRGYDVLG